jgi:hypothetical protein
MKQPVEKNDHVIITDNGTNVVVKVMSDLGRNPKRMMLCSHPLVVSSKSNYRIA